MSATTEPKADAPRGAGRIEAALDAFDAAETEQAPAAEARPAPSEQAQTPAAEDTGRTTPPRDEHGRFVSQQAETPPTAGEPPAQAQALERAREQQPPTAPAQPDEVATLREEMRQLQSRLGNYDQMRQENQTLRQQMAQGEQAWRQREAERVEQARRQQRDDLNQRIAAALGRGELSEQDAQIHRDRLEGQFAREDLARLQAEREAERQGWTAQLGTVQQQYQRALLPQVLPQVLATYAGQLAAKTAQHGAGATPEEAAAFLADPAVRQQIEWAWLQPLPPDAKERLVDSIEAQQAWALAERSRLTTERREWEQQRQLAGNRARATGDGATRELVPGAAGEGAPDYSRYRNSGNVAGALDAYEEDRQAGRAQ